VAYLHIEPTRTHYVVEAVEEVCTRYEAVMAKETCEPCVPAIYLV
jgi:hypothetical protein